MNTNSPKAESITFSKVLDSFYVYTGDDKDKMTQDWCKTGGYWDKELTEWMIANIQPGWTCLDVGAGQPDEFLVEPFEVPVI